MPLVPNMLPGPLNPYPQNPSTRTPDSLEISFVRVCVCERFRRPRHFQVSTEAYLPGGSEGVNRLMVQGLGLTLHEPKYAQPWELWNFSNTVCQGHAYQQIFYHEGDDFDPLLLALFTELFKAILGARLYKLLSHVGQ